MIFDIVEYIIMEGAYPKKKKKSVAGQFATVKYKSETYCWTEKLNREDCGVDRYFLLTKLLLTNNKPCCVAYVSLYYS